MKIIFIGNPGTGKSTLLNGIMGAPKFRSGTSFGAGMTQAVQFATAGDGVHYGDTPGLADVKLREKAAKEISAALRSGKDDYKLVFIVTQEAGRVRPADCVTMKLVLDALPSSPPVPYGIVVNKVSNNMIKKLETDKEGTKIFVACLNDGRDNPTMFIHFHPWIEELEDEDNKVHPPTKQFQDFLKDLPPIKLEPKNVRDVKASEFDKVQKKFEQDLEAIRKEKAILEDNIRRQNEDFEKQKVQLQVNHQIQMSQVRRKKKKNCTIM